MNKETIAACLSGKTTWAGSQIIYFDKTDSTNTRAWQAQNEQSTGNGALFVADCQLQGRGRRGRSWDSPVGKNIYFSLVLRSRLKAYQAPMTTLVMALSVARAIAAHTGLRAEIKWPNDIVVQGKKVCGILTEMKPAGENVDFIVIGVGINVGKQLFAPELADKATDLSSCCEQSGAKTEICREELLAEILEAFEKDYAQLESVGDLSQLRPGYEELLVNQNRPVQVLEPAGAYVGIARGITDTGELLVDTEGGSCKRVYAGEVSVRGVYGYV